MTPELSWAEICDAADRLNPDVGQSGLVVRAVRRRSLLEWAVTEGIAVMDNWTDVFEPVRRRRLLRAMWQEVQSVERAAENIRSFLRERPDLA